MRKNTIRSIVLIICMLCAASCSKATMGEEAASGQVAEEGLTGALEAEAGLETGSGSGSVASGGEGENGGNDMTGEFQGTGGYGEGSKGAGAMSGIEEGTEGDGASGASDGITSGAASSGKVTDASSGTSSSGKVTDASSRTSSSEKHANASSGTLSSEKHTNASSGTSASGTHADAAGTAGAGAELGVPGGLAVVGTQLVDASGNPVQLRGISTHGLAWYPEYVNAECFRQFQEEWGMNVVRLAMYTAESGGYCTGGDRDALKELVKNGVSYATDCGMYVIIDWHILSDGNPNTYLEEAKAFFGEMSETYAGYTNVLYEICNEPNGGTSWGDIKRYAEQIIEVIREKDEDSIILVGTPNWSQYVEQAAADPITGYGNIMYTLHFYAATHTDYLRDAFTRAVEDGLPIFVSEYGICDASGNGAIDTYQADKWMELLDQYGISYVAWNLSNKSEASAILKSSCSKLSGFVQDDLSDSGKWLYERMGASGGNAGSTAGGTGNAGSGTEGTAGVGNTGSGTGGTAEAGNAGSAVGGAAGVGNTGSGTGGTAEAGNAGSAAVGTAGAGEISGNHEESGKNTDQAGSGGGNAETGSGLSPSGESTGTAAVSNGLNITAKVINSWGEGSDTYYQYDLTLSNPTETARNAWTIQLVFSCDIELQNGWNGTYAVEGNVLTISSMDYNGYMEKGGSVENVGFIIRAEADCRLEE